MFFVFFIFWVVLNGRITAEIAVFGLVISAAMYFFICRYMGYSVEKDLRLMKCVPYLVLYFLNLVREIILSTCAMTCFILIPKKKAEPQLIHFRSGLKLPTSRMILADSITMTPGTLTVDLIDDDFYIHCYDRSFGEGIDDSSFVRMLKKIEERAV